MSTDKLAAAARELVERWMGKKHPITMQSYVSDLTALISEHYVEREEHDKVVQQRDELMERCKQLEFMIEKGLGWDDIKNDITMPHEL